jgi:hypothetical protein
MVKFISIAVRPAITFHGYTPDNQEIIEEFPDQPFAEKLIAVDRIQSVTEQYILVTSSHGRVMYWEYEGTLADLTARLNQANLVV